MGTALWVPARRHVSLAAALALREVRNAREKGTRRHRPTEILKARSRRAGLPPLAVHSPLDDGAVLTARDDGVLALERGQKQVEDLLSVALEKADALSGGDVKDLRGKGQVKAHSLSASRHPQRRR